MLRKFRKECFQDDFLLGFEVLISVFLEVAECNIFETLWSGYMFMGWVCELNLFDQF